MKNYFSSNLKFIRETKKLSKNKLGELVGVNQTTISRWENGIISPSIDNVIDLLNALHIPMSNLGNFLGKNFRNNNLPNITKQEPKKIFTEKGVTIYIDEEKKLTAEDVLDVNKVLMEELSNKK